MEKIPTTIMQILEDGVRKDPERVALICEGTAYTFQELDRITDTVAANMLKNGITKGSKVGINFPNIPEWVFCYFGLAKIGAVAVGLNVRYRETELEYMLNQSDACAVVSSGLLKSPFGDFDFVTYFGDLRSRFPEVKNYFFLNSGKEPLAESFDGAASFGELLAEPSAEDMKALQQAKSRVTPEDPVIIIYTSGTTGKPKGALITQKSQIASAYGQAVRTGMNEKDSFVTALPLNHVAGITCSVLSLLMVGAKVILQPFFIPSQMIKLCSEHKATVFGGVTTMIAYMLKDPSFRPEALGTVRITMTGGSNVEPELMEGILKNLPQSKVMNLYGLSECSGGVVMSTLDDEKETLLNSIGRPLRGFRIKVVDDAGSELGANETGELLVIGDCVAAGYYNWPEATAEAFVAEGVLTGDMGYVDEKGYVYLRGRKKEMYIQGGYNIYPAEIENILVNHPKVSMAAGIGVPDPVMGEIGRYYIIPATGVTLTSEELTEYLKEHLANYKIPREFVFVEELPLTPAGKIHKAALKEQYEKSS